MCAPLVRSAAAAAFISIAVATFTGCQGTDRADSLAPGQTYTHVHRTYHFTGPEAGLDRIARATLNVGIAEIASVFSPARVP